MPRVPAGSGRPLDPGSRRFFEQRFGFDFGAVRIHASSEASSMTRALDAHAYTLGHDIVVDAADFSTSTDAGRRLLAHELAHVVQQRRGGSAPEASIEADAHQAAARAVAPGPGRADVRVGAPLVAAFERRRSASVSHSGAVTSRSDTEALVQREVTRLRPQIPSTFDIGGMATFDSVFYARGSDLFDFRGRVMRGWEVNYYFIAMAMAHQGYSWAGAQDMIWTWNTLQDWGVIPGGGDMTAEMWFAARQGYDDEIARLPPRREHVPFSSPPFTCFPPDVPVTMADGREVAIGGLRPGDEVLAADARTGAIRACEVTHVHVHPAGHFLRVHLADGRTLEVTSNHPLWVGGRWVAAGTLRPGDALSTLTADRRDLARVEVVAIEPSPTIAASLHDITVSDCHTFFAAGVLVHNKLP